MSCNLSVKQFLRSHQYSFRNSSEALIRRSICLVLSKTGDGKRGTCLQRILPTGN